MLYYKVLIVCFYGMAMKAHQDKGNGSAGFTLTEVVIAMAVLAIAGTGFGVGFVNAMRTNRQAKNYYHATTLARNRIQRARAMAFDSLPLLAEVEQPIDEKGTPHNAGAFARTTLVEPHDSLTYRIAVELYYPDTRGNITSAPVTIETILHKAMAY